MSQHGTLYGMAVTAGMAIPLPGVSVSVMSTGSPPELIAHRITDESGITPPIEIETPDFDLSLSPGDQPVSTLVNMRFDLDNYRSVIIENVQVFPDTTSIQTAETPPLPEFASRSDEQIIYIRRSQDL